MTPMRTQGSSMFPRSVLAAVALTVFGASATPVGSEGLASIAPRPDEALVLTLAARGVQVYECRVGAGQSGQPGWALVRPEAVLFNDGLRAVGRHGAGPVWRADDGSLVTGRVEARIAAPMAGAIPWLLLSASPAASPGQFSGITSIQRVHTIGGAAPASGCSPQKLGRFARVPYRADYLFYAPRLPAMAAHRERPL